MLMTAGDIKNKFYVSMNNILTNLFGKAYHFIFYYNRLTWIQAVIVEQVFLKKNFNFRI